MQQTTAIKIRKHLLQKIVKMRESPTIHTATVYGEKFKKIKHQKKKKQNGKFLCEFERVCIYRGEKLRNFVWLFSIQEQRDRYP